jgi:hypothetical protein
MALYQAVLASDFKDPASLLLEIPQPHQAAKACNQVEVGPRVTFLVHVKYLFVQT